MQTLLEPPSGPVRGTIPLSAAELRLQRRITLLFTTGPLVGVAIAMALLWQHGISGLSFGLFLGFYLFTGLGITVGFHRLFTHRSFRALPPVRWALAVAGSMALEGSIISWVATHRRHHAFADQLGDPHSPHLALAPGLRGVLLGLWHAHMGWFFDESRSDPGEWAPDLVEERAMKNIDRAFPWLTVTTFFLPPLIALAATGSFTSMVAGFIWGSLVRIFLLHHVTWSINSICHFYGKEAYRAHDESRNVWPLSALSFGESWHNNHHAFPWSARLGLRFWQVDPGWYAIRAMRGLRLVDRVKVPTRAQMRARRHG